MGRQRSPDRDKAKQTYLNSKGTKKLKDIAIELGLKDTQIRKWKSIDKWDDELKGNVTNKSTKKKSNVTKKNTSKVAKKENVIIEELEDADLTEKQRLFCLYYVKTFNATQSAIKAGYSKDTAHVIGHENLRKPKIADEIKRLKGTMSQDIFIDAMDVLRKYVEIAFADITDFVSFGKKEVQAMGPSGPLEDDQGNPITKEVNFIDFKNSSLIDGTILSEVSQGRDGVKIKLADKMKALEKLEKYFDLLPDKWKRQLEEEKIRIQKKKIEPDNNPNDNKKAIDEFIKATSMSEEEIETLFEGETDEEV